MRRTSIVILLLATACSLERVNGPKGGMKPSGSAEQFISTLPSDVILVLDGDVARPTDQSADAESIRARIRALPPARIERVEVLKGAAATAQFGPSATTGAIFIYTKR